nr:DUF2510 domain-containing protein [Streptomyces sp. CBG30]
MTPPGWHPDPGHSGKGPDQERWWDGVQWTAMSARRPPRSAAVASVSASVL